MIVGGLQFITLTLAILTIHMMLVWRIWNWINQ